MDAEVIGSSGLMDSWFKKQLGIYQICEALFECRETSQFPILYWALRTHGAIAMEFKDFTEAIRVFRKLK